MRPCGCQRDPAVFGHEHPGDPDPGHHARHPGRRHRPEPAMTAIYDQLQRDWPHHQLPSAPADPPEDAMSLETIEQDVRTRVEDFVSRAEEDVTRGREILDEHLPALIKEAEVAAKPLVAAAKALDLPEAWIPTAVSFLEGLGKLAATSPAPPAPETPAAAPLDDAQAAMAEAASQAPSAPVVGGQAR